MQRLSVIRSTLIIILLSLSLAFLMPAFLTPASGRGNSGTVFALPPPTVVGDDLTPGPVPQDSSVVGVASTAIDCLSTERQPTVDSRLESIAAVCPSTDAVELNWRGEAESARLVLSIPDPATAPQAAHSILVNGQAAGALPLCSITQPCAPGEYFYLNLPLEAIRQGTNQIEITVDGPGSLEAPQAVVAHLRLEVMGQLIPVQPQPSDLTATGVTAAATPFMISFKNSFDSTNQKAMAQVPDSYNPSVPTPLVVYAHARSRTMEDGPDQLGAATNSKGWLLVSPQMHGSWPIPPECFKVPNNCDYDDQVLAGTTPSGGPARPGAWAHASLESQYDVIGATKYMVDHYNVKVDQIYLVGGSMGAQTIGVTAAKFPHVYAAVYSYMGISNLGQWYWELTSTFDRRTLAKECHVGGVPKSPAENPFCYQRRSSTEFARNLIHTPISLTHSVFDELVPISHSQNLRNAINSFDPDVWVSLYEERPSGWRCDPPHHCLDPDWDAVLRYLDSYRLNRNPTRIRIVSDESIVTGDPKLFYWMKLNQISGARFSYLDVTRDPDSPTVEVTVNDTSPLRIGLNLGTGWQAGKVISQPGMGLPATTYLLKGAGYNKLVDYSSGYLTTQVNTSGTSTFTLSALDVDVTANPAVIPDDGQSHSSFITIQVLDSSDQANPVPNGTTVQLRTTEGRFANGQKTLSVTTLNGRATTTLTVDPTDDLAQITATVWQAAGTATVNIIKPAIELELIPASQTAYAGVPFNMDYRIKNAGDVTLSAVTVTDDSGPGGPLTVCQGLTLAPGASTVCVRQVTLHSSTAFHAQVSGQVSTGDSITDSDSASIAVIAPSMELSSHPNPLFLTEGESGSLTYRVANSGDTVLTWVKIQDDDGQGGLTTICSGMTLQPGAIRTCSRPVQLTQPGAASGAASDDSLTLTATATGQDPLDKEISVQIQTLVTIGKRIFIPLAYNR